MPPPSENQVTRIAEVITASICPPEVGRTSAWRGWGDSAASPIEAIEGTQLPTSATLTSVLGLPDHDNVGLASVPLRIERRMTADARNDTTREISRSRADPCACRQLPMTPSNSLLRYEFSNVRVGFQPNSTSPRASPLTRAAASANPFLVVSPLRKQICRHANVRQTDV